MTGFTYRCLSLLLALCLLTGCAGTYRTYAEMFKLAFTTPADITLPFEQVASSSYDYLYLRVGTQPRAALGLAFIEQQQFKWVSGEQELLITEAGRIVRTAGLANDLLMLTNRQADPLQAGVFRGASWVTAADWESGEYGVVLRSRFREQPIQHLRFFEYELPVRVVVEQVVIETPSRFWRFDGQWQNWYWFDAESGVLLQSQQQLAAGQPPFELIFISEVVRVLQRRGVTIAEDAL